MRRITYALAVCVLVLLGTTVLCHGQSSRYDQQILSNVARVMAGNPVYQDVTVQVENGVVILDGSVTADSVRRDLEVKIRHIDHVTDVVDQITIISAVLTDDVLRDLLLTRLDESGYPDVKVNVRDGAVTVQGAVRTERGWNWVKEIVSLTPGVKSVRAAELEVVNR